MSRKPKAPSRTPLAPLSSGVVGHLDAFPMNDTQYRNVDLELESASNLAPLAEYFADRAHVLFSGRVEDSFHLALETLCVGCTEPLLPTLDADACIQDFIALISQLPPSLRALWDGCSSRVFDVGFDAGTAPMPFRQILTENTLTAVSSVRAAVRITIYPQSRDR
jgi:hypothetical protein